MLKLLVLLTLATLTLVKVADSELCAGCPTTLTGEDLKEAEDRLSETFTKLAAGTGPTYTIEKVLTASKQVVSGTKYVFKATINGGDKNSETCDIIVVIKRWVPNGDYISIKCPNDEEEIEHTV